MTSRVPCGVGFALVDDEDLERVLAVGTWTRDARGYVVHHYRTGYNYHRTSGVAAVKLHRFVLGLSPEDPGVDHRNGDKLDCRKGNLRLASQRTQGVNLSSENGRGRSRFRGVTWYARTGKWRAATAVGGTYISLGLHRTEEEAAEALRRHREKNEPEWERR